MRMEFFGDSYDVVKRFLLRELAPDARWAALPMFTEAVTSDDITRLAAFLSVNIASSSVLAPDTDRKTYFSTLGEGTHVFLDPDTGIKLKTCRGSRAPRYVFGSELVDLCLRVPARLLLTFDQSLLRGRERQTISAKLTYFQKAGLSSFAYVSHACFVVLSANAGVCQSAQARLRGSGLPRERVVDV
jgi:hypothetical protein